MAARKKALRQKAHATRGEKPKSGRASKRTRLTMARGREPVSARRSTDGHGVKAGSKQALLVDRLSRPEGATIGDLTKELAWLPHTVRAALTGLRRKGYAVARAKTDAGETVYRATPPVAEAKSVGGRKKRAA
jgi:Protein of unknown function (DUF3489)